MGISEITLSERSFCDAARAALVHNLHIATTKQFKSSFPVAFDQEVGLLKQQPRKKEQYNDRQINDPSTFSFLSISHMHKWCPYIQHTLQTYLQYLGIVVNCVSIDPLENNTVFWIYTNKKQFATKCKMIHDSTRNLLRNHRRTYLSMLQIWALGTFRIRRAPDISWNLCRSKPSATSLPLKLKYWKTSTRKQTISRWQPAVPDSPNDWNVSR